VDRTPDDLARAAVAAGAVLLSHELVQRKDGSWTLAGRFGFDDPWAAARLLCILAEEDADEPAVQEWSRSILEETADAYGTTVDDPTILDAFAAAVHANVQGWIRFAPEEGERFQSASTTMIEGVGDCDCHARLVHALMRAQGAESELRFFESEDEPVHAVAALGTSQGPAWAETTIAAAFGEHPQEAYRRLGLDRANTRPDIGFLGLEFVTPKNVADRKAELDVYVVATDQDVTRCTTLDPSTRAAWVDFVVGWKAFLDDKPGWFDAGAQGRQAAEYADTIHEWQTKLAAICTTSLPSAPIVPTAPQDPTVGLIKTVAVVVGLVAGAVVVVKVLDVLPKRRAAT
jgi:transglutaminase-like putative cysteine protease